MRESVGGVITDTKLIIAEGSYTVASLASAVSVALQTLQANYTVSVASTQNKLIITSDLVFPNHSEILTRQQLTDRSLTPA